MAITLPKKKFPVFKDRVPKRIKFKIEEVEW